MSRLPLLLLLIAAPLFAATTAQTLTTRSTQHRLRLERHPLDKRVVYDVVVEDAVSGALLLSDRVELRAQQKVEIAGGAGTKRVRVGLTENAISVTATVSVVDAKKVVDEFRRSWHLGADDDNLPPVVNAPDAMRVGGNVTEPIAVHHVDPTYPDSARGLHAGGKVVVEIVVGKDGRVKDAAVRKGVYWALDDAALAAVRKWEFEPATLDGKPVEVIFDVTFVFRQ